MSDSARQVTYECPGCGRLARTRVDNPYGELVLTRCKECGVQYGLDVKLVPVVRACVIKVWDDVKVPEL